MTHGGIPPEARLTPAGLDADVLERLHVGVWSVDRDGVSTYANRYLCELLQVPADRIVGHPLLDFWHPGDHAMIVDRVRRRRDGQSDHYDARLQRNDGTTVHVRVQASPVGPVGEFQGAVAVITDLSDLTAAASERDHALRAAETASLTKTRFLSWVSHELRTPLNTISGFAQLLEGSLEQQSQREMATSILTACAHVNSLVQDLLDYSKADANMLEPSLHPVSVRSACAAAAGLVSGAARDLEVTLDTDVDDVYVMADERHLVQVIVNLLSNAVKYGGRGSTVRTRTAVTDTTVRIAISDEGPGIPPELQQRAFRPFERLENATTVDGVGLGLSIAESLVRAMLGSLTLVSPPGAGATFTIELPVTEPTRDDIGAPTASPDAPRNQLVLYVEDEPLNASLVESIIGLLPGRSLHVEPTVAGGIEAVHRLLPALVLLDLNLPDGSGFEVLSSIRADPALAGVPVFILSADATEQATGRARELGADRFITKPFNLKEFVSLVEAAT
jgi:PAS domain S-box-containing protein